MSDIDAVKGWTKAVADSIMLSMQTPSPDVMLVSPYVRSVFVTFTTAKEERWDWRRTKRELRRLGLKRKGVRREYHRSVQ